MRNHTIEEKLTALREMAFLRPEEGVKIVTLTCEGCQGEYEETLEEAATKTVCDDLLLCIDCDEEARDFAAYGVRFTVWFTW